MDSLIRCEKDDRYVYFLKYGILRRYEGDGDILFVEVIRVYLDPSNSKEAGNLSKAFL